MTNERAQFDRVADEVWTARRKAHAKHGDNSIESISYTDPRWLSILVEEVGELAHEMTYDSNGTKDTLRGELIDVLAVASAWVDSLDGDDPRCTVCGRDNRNGTHDALEHTGHLSHSFVH